MERRGVSLKKRGVFCYLPKKIDFFPRSRARFQCSPCRGMCTSQILGEKFQPCHRGPKNRYFIVLGSVPSKTDEEAQMIVEST